LQVRVYFWPESGSRGLSSGYPRCLLRPPRRSLDPLHWRLVTTPISPPGVVTPTFPHHRLGGTSNSSQLIPICTIRHQKYRHTALAGQITRYPRRIADQA